MRDFEICSFLLYFLFFVLFGVLLFQDFKLKFSIKNLRVQKYILLQTQVVHIYNRKYVVREVVDKNLPRHQQGDHGNQSEGQMRSSDHHGEPERTKGKIILGQIA